MKAGHFFYCSRRNLLPKLTLLSNAGGVGKTTLTINLAYEIYLRGKTVAIVDLDNNCSLDVFLKLKPCEIENSVESVFTHHFQGNWHLKPVLGTNGEISVIQGSPNLSEKLIANERRREYILAQNLQQYPIDFDVIIFDCPSGLDLITDNALVAANSILVPIQFGVKALTVPTLISSIELSILELRLSPAPEILGIIPNQYQPTKSQDKQLQEALPEIAEKLGVNLYPSIQYWQHLKNSCTSGMALKQQRPGDKLCNIFSLIVDDLLGGHYGQASA